VLNGAPWIEECLRAVLAQDDGRPFEVIVIDDGSTDGSPEIVARFASDARVRILAGPRQGAARAINLGIAHARHPILCQVDQDVIPKPGWMHALLAELEVPGVAAAQGWYETDRRSSLWVRVMGIELELRYSRLSGRYLDHVCTGNTAYRLDAVRALGGFDEQLGYGYDNDLSYRLGAAGYKLAFCREARSIHRWRETAWGYVKQQYGFGYGRIDLVAKHKRRASGDQVSPFMMMMHSPLLLTAIGLALISPLSARLGLSPLPSLCTSGAIVAFLAGERLWAGALAWRKFRDPAAFFFVPAHLLRDLAWCAAILAWLAQRIVGRSPRPTQSMTARVTTRDAGGPAAPPYPAEEAARPSPSRRR